MVEVVVGLKHKRVVVPIEPQLGGMHGLNAKAVEGVYIVPRGTRLQFVIEAGSPLLEKDPQFWTNYPTTKCDAHRWKRNDFHKLSPTPKRSDWTVDFLVDRAGAFDYYLELKPNHRGCKGVKTSVLHFVVDPLLHINGQEISPSGLVIQTVLTKCLGPLSRWESLFESTARNGYNMIHFTPVQVLGASGSCYSLEDQMTLGNSLFESGSATTHRDASLREMLQLLEDNHGLLSMTDVVWNHTAHTSAWLLDHPECGYNIDNSPHLEEALAVDDAILFFSDALARGHYDMGAHISEESELNRVMECFRTVLRPRLRLWEFYVVDIPKSVGELRTALLSGLTAQEDGDIHVSNRHKWDTLQWNGSVEDAARVLRTFAIHRNGHGRFAFEVQVAVAVTMYQPHDRYVDEAQVESVCRQYEAALNMLNMPAYRTADRDFDEIANNVRGTVYWERVDPAGPRNGPVTADRPLSTPYFTRLPCNIGNSRATVALANNGWVMGLDPKMNFASSECRAYALRRVMIWGDCVKLRYGESEADNPWLWKYMRQYTEAQAKLFHGIRIDNCHSTPVNVARHMLDAARRVRSELYVTAELFSGSAIADAEYVAKLGINSLIREGAHPHDAHHVGELIHRFGGKPVASIDQNQALLRPHTVELRPRLPGSLLYDCTHDNETPAQRRTARDSLPSAAAVAMAHCASGSARGFDELRPRTIDLVKEMRVYQKSGKGDVLGPAKQRLNLLHRRMAKEGFTELHVHDVSPTIVVFTRHNPSNHHQIHMVCHFAFRNTPDHDYRGHFIPNIAGKVVQPLMACSLHVEEDTSHFQEGRVLINGLQGHVSLNETGLDGFCVLHDRGATIDLEVVHLPPGSVVAFETALTPSESCAFSSLQRLVLSEEGRAHRQEALRSLSYADFNVLLFMCGDEERHSTHGKGSPYNFPNHGELAFCGLAGLAIAMEDIRNKNDMGHPILANLREGDWYHKYQVERLYRRQSLSLIRLYLAECVQLITSLPRYVVPRAVDLVVSIIYRDACKQALSTMSTFVSSSNSRLVKQLSLTLLQLHGDEATSLNPPPSTDPSLAAGLPYFSTGVMRSWGRDTCISMRGLYLVTGCFSEARTILLAFASCLRHGLIPNLIDRGINPRYNARDATWWFLQALQDYCLMSPEGSSFLSELVTLRFFNDNESEASANRVRQLPLHDVVQEILQKHAAGIAFREWMAGPDLDRHMSDDGFNVHVWLDKTTGFLFGGNRHNCGTWMDKMGESCAAGNMGVPGTPRDGAAVELVGLLKSTVRWLTSLHGEGLYPYSGVELTSSRTMATSVFTYKEWDEVLLMSFEKYFFVPMADDDDGTFYVGERERFDRLAVYKDTYGSNQEFTDYQLRPNQCVAMVVAPELFDPKHALLALQSIESILVGTLGVKTLDPRDWNYRGNYHNDVDSSDYHTARGFNYHQGPEWLWLMGYFLRAKLIFDDQCTAHWMNSKLRAHRTMLESSPYRSLPELTNENGAPCPSSCPSQAWSVATLLDALYDCDTRKT